MTGHVVLPADAEDWIAHSRTANLLARAGAAPRRTAAPCPGVMQDGAAITVPAGSFVIDAAAAAGPALPPGAVSLRRLDGAAGDPIRPIRIAVYGGGGAPYNHAAAFAALGFLTEFVLPADILAGALRDFDVLAVPGGGARAMMGQLDPLGEDGCRRIAAFVAEGGMYLGSCAGAFDASIVSEAFVAACPQQRHLQMINAAVWNDGDAWMGLQSPGVGVIRATVAVPDHPVMLGLPDSFELSHYNGPLYALRQGAVAGASDATGLMRVAGAGRDFTPAERFLGGDAPPEGWLLTRAATEGAFNAVAGNYRKGRVVLFGSHPEFGLSLDLADWAAPARLLANAGFWQAGSPGPARSERRPPHAAWLRVGAPLSSMPELRRRIDSVATAATALRQRDVDGAGWLADGQAMSTFGATGRAIWDRNLAAFATIAGRMDAEIDRLEQVVPATADTADAEIAAARDGVEQAIRYATPADWALDFGYEGVLQQLDRAAAMLSAADTGFGQEFPPDPNPYAYLEQSPFHLAVGSYLSAAGVFGNGLLTLRMAADRLANAAGVAQLRGKAESAQPPRAPSEHEGI